MGLIKIVHYLVTFPYLNCSVYEQYFIIHRRNKVTDERDRTDANNGQTLPYNIFTHQMNGESSSQASIVLFVARRLLSV